MLESFVANEPFAGARYSFLVYVFSILIGTKVELSEEIIDAFFALRIV